MVVVPVVFMTVYPIVMVLLPERLAILADLPRDLTLLVLLNTVFVPILGGIFYWRARRRAAKWAQGVPRDEVDTCDVY
jgi:ACR3 family arsenite efflux pump ArsB